MSTGCSKCEASAGHGVIQYQTGCSKCENRLRHESCFIFPYYVLSVCPSLSIYIYITIIAASYPLSAAYSPRFGDRECIPISGWSPRSLMVYMRLFAPLTIPGPHK